MAQNLPKDISFTAVANSIISAGELRNYDNIDTIMVGGEMSQKGQGSDYFAIEFGTSA